MIVELTSDITKKKYTGNNYEKTLKTMREDEKEFQNNTKKSEAEAKEITNLKKELCDKIDEAEKLIDTAHQHYINTYKDCESDVAAAKGAYDKAVADALQVYSDRIKLNQKTLASARKAEAEARKTYNSLVADYHNRFDKNYTKILEGKEAVKEYNRICKEIAEINPFFAWFL